MGQQISSDVLSRSEHVKKVWERVQNLSQDSFGLSDWADLGELGLIAVKSKGGVKDGLDDRQLLLEKALVFMAKRPTLPFVNFLEGAVIDLLYKDLPHPSVSFLATLPPSTTEPTSAKYKGVTYAYRSANGSSYSPSNPSIGKAGTPYARSVPSELPLPPQFLPDSGLVFDTLLKREKFEAHPGGVSSLFFAFADLVIHSIFNTNHRDPTINDTSSYLDLSILYGNSEKDIDTIRRKDGTGRLWDDVFADNRLIFMPPSACALLVLLSRNHNYIADRIFRINEKGTYSPPETLSEEDRLSQDHEMFQRSRLVNCGHFMQIIMGDYVGAILGLVRDGYSWRLGILEHIRDLDHDIAPRGDGNVVSVEFNLMYRWHSTLSEADAKWTEEMLSGVVGGKDLSKVSPADFISGARTALRPSPDPRQWVFGGLERDEEGKFKNADLAKILHNATEASASAFKARGVPEALRVIEIMGIEQARNWGTCSLNEFRKFMGLKPYESFAEWNPDPTVYQVAESLYQNINNLELYVGLQAEQAKEPGPGAGLCPGYTVSRAILADAVCLTRGDRFMTVEFTPQNLTAWGYQDCQLDPYDGSYGGMLTKLLFRHLPEFYPVGSAYAHFPFLVPESTRVAIAKLPDNVVNKYDWTRPGESPVTAYLLNDTVVEERLKEIVGGTQIDHSLVENILTTAPILTQAAGSLGEITRRLFQEKDIEKVGGNARYIDIVRDVFKRLPILGLGGDELKDINFDDLLDVAQYVYINEDPEQAFSLKTKAIESTRRFVAGVTTLFESYVASPPKESDNLPLLPALFLASDGLVADQATLVASVVANVLPTLPLYSKVLTLVIDTLLEKPAAEWAEEHVRAALNNAVQSLGGYRPNHGLVHDAFLNATVPHIVGVIGELKDISRGPGVSGRVSGLSGANLYLNPKGQLTPWPISMVVQYVEV